MMLLLLLLLAHPVGGCRRLHAFKFLQRWLYAAFLLDDVMLREDSELLCLQLLLHSEGRKRRLDDFHSHHLFFLLCPSSASVRLYLLLMNAASGALTRQRKMRRRPHCGFDVSFFLSSCLCSAPSTHRTYLRTNTVLFCFWGFLCLSLHTSQPQPWWARRVRKRLLERECTWFLCSRLTISDGLR